jgi:hypothetical protein
MATETATTDTPNPLHFADDAIAQSVLEKMQARPEFFQRDTPDDAGTGGASADDAVTSAVSADEVPPAAPTAEEPGADAPSEDAPPTDTPERPVVYTVDIDGQSVDLTPAQLQQLIGLNQWASGLEPTVKEQFAHIEQGRAIAVPTDEFAAYRAWKATNQPSTVASRTVPEWVEDLDPAARQAFDQQAAEIAALREQVVAREAAPLADQHNAETTRIANLYDAAMSEYGAANGFTDEQIGSLVELALPVLPTLVESQRKYSPSGMLVHDADYKFAMKQALDYGRLQNPLLAPGVQTNPNIPTPAPAPTPQVDATSIKKSRAASLSAAPSAATTIPTLDPSTLDISQQRGAIAEILRKQGIAS